MESFGASAELEQTGGIGAVPYANCKNPSETLSQRGYGQKLHRSRGSKEARRTNLDHGSNLSSSERILAQEQHQLCFPLRGRLATLVFLGDTEGTSTRELDHICFCCSYLLILDILLITYST